MKKIKLKDFFISNDLPFILIAGPCVLESKNHAFEMIERILEITAKLKVNFYF